MKKFFLLFILLILSISAFSEDSDLKEKKPLPKYMYVGEELNLEKYFDLKQVSSVVCEPVVDKNLYPDVPVETEVTPEEENAYNLKIAAINQKFRIVKIREQVKLVAEKPGNIEFTLTFSFNNEQRTDAVKHYNISIVEYDQKELDNLSKRFNIKKIIIQRIIFVVIVLVIILLIIWAVINRKKKLERIRAKRKERRY